MIFILYLRRESVDGRQAKRKIETISMTHTTTVDFVILKTSSKRNYVLFARLRLHNVLFPCIKFDLRRNEFK